MSFTTFFTHIIFSNISFLSRESIIYIIPLLSLGIISFTLKIMFYTAPKLRKIKS